MKLTAIPLELHRANAFVEHYHRHNGKVRGHKFSIGAEVNGVLVGVAIVAAYPTARELRDGFTLEITRLCTDGTYNACSFLEGCATRAAFALGYRKIITYALKRENGASMRAANFRVVAEVRARSWDTPKRRRDDKHAIEPRLRLEVDKD